MSSAALQAQAQRMKACWAAKKKENYRGYPIARSSRTWLCPHTPDVEDYEREAGSNPTRFFQYQGRYYRKEARDNPGCQRSRIEHAPTTYRPQSVGAPHPTRARRRNREQKPFVHL